MACKVFNSLEKLSPPPYVTTVIESPETQGIIFKTWSSLKKKFKVDELSKILGSEAELLSGFINRKGTQLRLEKALMLSNRIQKLGRRWQGNKWLGEWKDFVGALELSLQKKKMKGAIRLPSRQWANWVIYLMLRDILILAKVKDECERTVKYWLGLISSSHHATDSLVAVGILSRMWYVSSSLVESLINLMYPTVCKLSIHLQPTKAENWLMDLEIPSPEDLPSWLAAILGSPFLPARLSTGTDTISQGFLTEPKMESILKKSIKGKGDPARKTSKSDESVSVASTSTVRVSNSSDEEDFGEVVEPLQKRSKRAHPKKKPRKIVLNERWTQFFQGYKSKLKNEKGKKQFCVRIRKYLSGESDKQVSLRLKKLRKCIKSDSYSEMISIINKFQKFLSKQS